jgi:KAP family P-loop domain
MLGISNELYSISPVRIIILLERTSRDQATEALVITREQYYNAVEEKSESIRERYEAELESYRSVYVKRSRVRAVLCWFRGLLYLLNIIAFLVAYVALVLLVVLYLANTSLGVTKDNPLYSTWLLHVLTNKRDVLSLLAFAIAALLLNFLLRKLISHQIHRIYKPLQLSLKAFDQRLINAFRTIIIELMRKSEERGKEPTLVSNRAPILVEVESVRAFPSETFDEVVDFLEQHVTSAVGIAGSRGVGKSTLLRWLFSTLAPEWITVYLATPATYNAFDFARTIFGTTVNAILTNYQSKVLSARSRMWSAFKSAFRPRPRSVQKEIARISNDMLDLIGRSRTDQWTTTGGVSAKGASLTRQKQTTMSEREPTHPELIAAFTRYLETYRRLGGRKIVIAIDELDKLAAEDDAIGAVNSLKDLFHLPNTHFVVSVSEDALARFAMRGIPFRDVFDSAFDNIIRVEPPSPGDAWKLLAPRTGGFPISVALFCYAWSGGLPRDLIRAARECVEIRRRLDKPVTVAELTPTVVRHDLKNALNAALTRILEENSTQGVEAVLALRRKLEDESIPLADVLKTTNLRGELEVGNGDQDRLLLLQRLALYADLGRCIVDYFTKSFDEKMTTNSDEVKRITRKFARVKLALSIHPSEAEWLLSEALEAMKNDA